MKRRTPLLFTVLIAIVAFAASGVWWTSSRNSLRQLEVTRALALRFAAGDTNSIAALKARGPAAVPELLALAEYRDPLWRRAGWAILPKLPQRLRQFLLPKIGPLDAAPIRIAGCKALGVLGPLAVDAVPRLVAVLHDPESYIANEAAAALAKIGFASLPGLIDTLASANPSARHAAAYGLGEAGAQAQAAIPPLIGKLDDKDSQVRSSSASSLVLIGLPMIDSISNVVDQGDADARHSAISELLALNRSLRHLVPPLIKMGHARESGSRREAIQVLGAFRSADDATLQLFTSALHDPELEVRVAAISSLGLIPWRAAAAVPGLVSRLSDPSSEVRRSAAQLLGSIGPPAQSALPGLQRCASQDEPFTRAAAQDAIRKIALEKANAMQTTNDNGSRGPLKTP